MPIAGISQGLGLGGAATATISGAPGGGGGAFANAWSGDFGHDGANNLLTADPNTAHSSVDAYTMSAWVNFAAFTSGGGPYQMRGGLSTSDWSYNSFMRVDSASSVAYYHRGANYQEIPYTGVTLSTGSWYNFMQVWDGTSVKLYLQGLLINTSTTANTNTFEGRSGYNIKFDMGFGRTGYTACHIDEFAWWDSDKSGSASTIYNSGSPGDLFSLAPVHWYRMGDTDTDAAGGAGSAISTITDAGSAGVPDAQATGAAQPEFSTTVP